MKNTRFIFKMIAICCFVAMTGFSALSQTQTYKIVGTGVTVCFDNTTTIPCPTVSTAAFYGQFPGVNLPSYQDNGDGTITDLNTGLTWQSSPDANGDNDGIIEKTDKLTWTQIQTRVTALNSSNYAGHNDWRVPTMKQLYSITDFKGTDPFGMLTSTTGLTPFIDSSYFPFAWGNTSAGERIIDAQYASSNLYNDLSYEGYQKLFGMNFADGRIKGYDLIMPDGFTNKTFSFIAVRGNTAYGTNDFVDNGDQTITDNATGLMWTKDDSPAAMNWQAALAYAQTKNTANYCGHSDWRLPNAKELQSIIDYTRSPGTTHSASINPMFNISSFIAPNGQVEWPYFWTSTTHYMYNGTSYTAGSAVYISFGRAAGWKKFGTNTYYSYYDAHGAGAQRSDPKSGTNYGQSLGVDSLGNTVYAMGPQGDIIRINNYARLVRDVAPPAGIINLNKNNNTLAVYPNPTTGIINLSEESVPGNNFEIAVYNSFGKTIIHDVNIKTIDLSGYSNGIYFLQLISDNRISTSKVIMNK